MTYVSPLNHTPVNMILDTVAPKDSVPTDAKLADWEKLPSLMVLFQILGVVGDVT
jgi:hypothetical protein